MTLNIVLLVIVITTVIIDLLDRENLGVKSLVYKSYTFECSKSSSHGTE